MDDETARLAVLRDPKRMAALLVRAFSSSILENAVNGVGERRQSVQRRQEEEDEEVEKTQEEFQEIGKRARKGINAADMLPLRVEIHSVTEEDDDDDAEEEEEEEEEEESIDKPLDEEELEAAATALLAATRIVDELRLKMLLKAGQQMDRKRQDYMNINDQSPFSSVGMTTPVVSRSESSFTTNEAPGLPVPHARVRYNSTCSGCGKSFNPFHRSKNCAACGFAFCPKCSPKQLVLPSCFGHRDESVRTCTLCARWFQKAMDRYFDKMKLTTSHDNDDTIRAGSLGEFTFERKSRALFSFSSNTVPVSDLSDGKLSLLARPRLSTSSLDFTPDGFNGDAADGNGENDGSYITLNSTMSASRQRRRHSSIPYAPSSLTSKNKPWFSGHLSAIHVNDRLPRKKKSRGESESDADSTSPDVRCIRRSSVASAPSKNKYINKEIDDRPFVQQEEGRRRSPTHAKSSAFKSSLDALLARIGNESESNDLACPLRKARRSKFTRSASFDFANLHSASPLHSLSNSSGMRRCNTFGPDEIGLSAAEVSSNGSGRTKCMRSKKAFDDSDIVDARAQFESVEGKLKTEAKFAAAVLRFAVYEMGGKEGTSLRRTFGFSKANPVLDRYTLELDCRQRIVRAKSVFMHRFWSFHCDSVQSFDFGSSEGIARLIVSSGSQENQSLELKFANDDEREQFKKAMNNCRSTNLNRMRELATEAAMSLPARTELPLSPTSDILRSPMPPEPTTTFSRDSSTAIESELVLAHDTGDSDGIDCPNSQSIRVPLLPGEEVVKDTELQATLLIGPVSETNESTLVWGRLRGKVAVTNYRVIFLPFDRVQVQPRCGGQGGIAYIPLFAITHVQIFHPGGRRMKAGCTNYAGMAGSASIISIACKDIRVMRFQLGTLSSVSEDHAHKLRTTIAKLADESQRYSVVERVSFKGTMSPRLRPLLSTNDACDLLPELGFDGETVLHVSRGPSLYSTSDGPRNPAYASPVLRPDRILTLPREISGSFAFSYSIGNISADQNGWNVFVDEREFKRQIGGDQAVLPFLKYYKNDRGNICKSYPSKLLLPASMTSATLVKVADFRAKNRLPVITYYHRRNRCVLTRSSQPLLGNLLSGTSNVSDQLLLGVYRRLPDIIKNQSQSSASSRPIYIFDARKPKASTGNRLMGKGGVEAPQDYPGAVVHHLNIANMYQMQSSLTGLMKLFLPGGFEDSGRTWLSSVESTRWLDHVRLVLDGALKIARVLELEGASVLVHCSDGWDRTAQLCALAQLMIDPYYRTVRGIICLIEKDWCAFGHKFSERTGGDRNRDPQRNKSSPIMFQFIDAVWQMQRQYPRSFEFSERFLLHLANAMTSGLYGTFLYDSRLQREVNEVKYNTVSVWTPVLMMPSLYSNSNYEMYDGPIWPWVSCKMIRLWESYFFQWHPKFYKCQWACSLFHHGPSTPESSNATSEMDDHDYCKEEAQQHEAPHQRVASVKDPPALDLLAPPITSIISEDDGQHEVPPICLSVEDRDLGVMNRTRSASGTYTQRTSKRSLFGLSRGSRQRAQSEENGS
ncbi:unnamed protein product [Peronospora belbahrii]|uniref:phosphatidylinositol-3,5-bisphosphate 3-phosphatase n=1 Tax=Peronospora belbahrii TaxID=622444 RepID=A0ABN8CZ49_9STRA|nr:unnamed protein product [Peronospora belbahrii]